MRLRLLGWRLPGIVLPEPSGGSTRSGAVRRLSPFTARVCQPRAQNGLRRRGRQVAVGCVLSALISSGCLLRDSRLAQDASAGDADAAQKDASTGTSASDKSRADADSKSMTIKGSGGRTAPGKGIAGAGGHTAAGGTSGGTKSSVPVGGARGEDNSDASAPAGSGDVCSQSVCTPEYPCEELESGYTCRGQFADWSPTYSRSFFEASGGIVKDSRNGLVWQQMVPSVYTPTCSQPYGAIDLTPGSACTWQEAKAYCESLSLAGGGWRLPTRAELESLLDESRSGPSIDTEVFPDTPPQVFWSSSTRGASPRGDTAWHIHFNTGYADFEVKTNGRRVRCVR